MIILGIDPGARDSAITKWDTETQKVEYCAEVLNGKLLSYLRFEPLQQYHTKIVIEDPQPQRRPASEDFIDTCKWSGRFREAIEWRFEPIEEAGYLLMIPYRDVSLHFCGIVNAKEKFVRDKIKELYGEPGTKRNPGPHLYGLSGQHCWSALAVALVAEHKIKEEK